MRTFLLLLFVCVSLNAWADDLDALGLHVTYKLPDQHWKLASQQKSADKGIVMFYNDAYPSSDPELIDPVLSIIYERLPSNIKTSRQYAEYSQEKKPFPLAGQKEIGDRVLYFHRWQAQFRNNLFRMFLIQNGIGIQALGSVTAEKFDAFQPQIFEFFSGISITANQAAGPDQ
jgi:hypothetical protein